MSHMQYVLLAYGISAAVLVILTLKLIISSRRLAARQRKLAARVKAAEAKTAKMDMP